MKTIKTYLTEEEVAILEKYKRSGFENGNAGYVLAAIIGAMVSLITASFLFGNICFK